MALAAPELGALAALLACAFLLSLYYAYGYSLGALLQLMAAAFDRVSFHLRFVGHVGLGFIGDAIRDLDNAVRRALGSGIAATEHGFHYFMHWNAYLLTQLGDALSDLADATLAKLQHTVTVTIPRWVGLRLDGVQRRVSVLEREIASLPHKAEVLVTRPVRVVRTEITQVLRRAVAIPLPRLGRLEREAEGIAGRIKALERKIAVGAGVALLVAALSKIGLGWVRCSKVSKVGKRACGLDEALLESLLADTLLVLGTINLVEFARGMQAIVSEVGAESRAFWQVR